MSIIFVKPAPGMEIPREPPADGLVPADGETVVSSPYYRRRIKDGGLVDAEPAAAPRQPRGDKA